VTLTISILRYRLYDIDFILHRTLVYVPVSALAAGLLAADPAEVTGLGAGADSDVLERKRAFVAAGLGWGLDGFDWTMFAYALPAITASLRGQQSPDRVPRRRFRGCARRARVAWGEVRGADARLRCLSPGVLLRPGRQRTGDPPPLRGGRAACRDRLMRAVDVECLLRELAPQAPRRLQTIALFWVAA
jgi:hypothetical protein